MTMARVGAAVLLAFGMSAAWSSGALSAPAARDCKLVDVAAFTNRVHVHCAHDPNSAGLGFGSAILAKIDYYAVELASPLAAHATWLGTWALLNGRTVSIIYDYNPGGNPAGCNQDDCARLTGIVVH